MARRRDRSKEKEKAADCFELGFGAQAASQIVGARLSDVQRWGYAYRTFGKEALLSESKYVKHDIDARLAAVTDVIEGGMTYAQAAAKHGIKAPSQLSKWVHLYREGGIDAIVPKKRGRKRKEPKVYATREEELEARVQELELELEIQKRINALADGRSS